LDSVQIDLKTTTFSHFLQIEPKDDKREALKTLYRISASGTVTSSANLQLSYRFSWKLHHKSEITFLAESRSGDETPGDIEITLPSSNSQDHRLIIVCEICNENDVCKTIEGSAEVLPREISQDELK
jgi:hypothetical protein